MKSIQRTLASWLVGGTVGLLALSSPLAWFITRHALYDSAVDSLAVLAGTVGGMLEARRGGLIFERNANVPTDCDRSDGPVAFEIRTADGGVVARSRSAGEHGLPRFEAGTREAMLAGGRRVLVHTRMATIEGRKESCTAEITVTRDLGTIAATLRTLGWVLLALGAALAGGTAFLAIFSLRRGLRPLAALGAQVERLDAAMLAQPLQLPGTPRELRPIVEHLEAMRQRLSRSFAAEQAFNGAVAHELRTPIAELRALTEAALAWPERVEPAHALRESLAIARQMERLVAALLALRRGDTAELEVERTEAPLAQVVRDVLRPLEERIRARRLEVSVQMAPGDHFVSDPQLVGAIVANLIENAVSHAPEGTRIACESRSEPGVTLLRVANAAPDLDAGELPRLFDAFWRKDAARTDSSHVGLGLTLARSYAQLLGLELTAHLDGNELVIELAQSRRAALEDRAAPDRAT